jgi:hypothetical protein
MTMPRTNLADYDSKRFPKKYYDAEIIVVQHGIN